MTDIGFEEPLYLLTFDDRDSFQARMFGWKGAATAAQIAQVVSAKQAIYDGFKASLAQGVPKGRAGIVVDEHYGASILHDATEHGYTICCCCERGSQGEFDFEFGDEFDRHIEAVRPAFCKVRVRYNPEDDPALNGRQVARLRRLSEYLHRKSQSRFMFELMVPPLKTQLGSLKGDTRTFDRELRPQLVAHAIEVLQDQQVEPDVWQIEGLDRRDDCERVVAAARRHGRSRVGCIVLGRGEDWLRVRHWLATAASVGGFAGFAVGRAVYGEPLLGLRRGKISRIEAVDLIAHRYRRFVESFLRERLRRPLEASESRQGQACA
jgi:myo-inositol catabolism protein IolC